MTRGKILIITLILYISLIEANDNDVYRNIAANSFCSLDLNKQWRRGSGMIIKSWIDSIYPSNEIIQADLDTKFVFNTETKTSYPILINNKKSQFNWTKYGYEPLDGWLYGPVKIGDPNNQTSHAFIYPDFHTAIIGMFENNRTLKWGYEAKVKSFRCKNGIMELKFKVKSKHALYKREYATQNFITSYPTLMDPFDRNTVFLNKSRASDSGEGLFAKKDIFPNTMVVIYAGVRITDRKSLYFPNMTREEEEDVHKNQMYFTKEITLDVPPKYTSFIKYRASLGHKVNHDFWPNADFGIFTSPRFGSTRCYLSTQFIAKGEEIFVDYNYPTRTERDIKNLPDWYYKSMKEKGLL